MRPYQDVWQDGKLITCGERECASRYERIAATLPSPPFSVLDIGAYTGYFVTRILEDFKGASATAADNFAGLRAPGATIIPKRLSATDLARLPRHDVVLALSVLHHMPDWKQALREMMACRSHLIIEVCNPSESWMRRAASRAEVKEQYTTVQNLPGARLLGTFAREANGQTYERPMYLIPGTVQALTGKVFTGSGSCSRNMPRYDKGLGEVLGYEPIPGSLNLRLPESHKLGRPAVEWLPPSKRDRQFWRAWAGEIVCHAHVPGKRNHGPDCLELVAPVKLRDALGLADGDSVACDVEVGA